MSTDMIKVAVRRDISAAGQLGGWVAGTARRPGGGAAGRMGGWAAGRARRLSAGPPSWLTRSVFCGYTCGWEIKAYWCSRLTRTTSLGNLIFWSLPT